MQLFPTYSGRRAMPRVNSGFIGQNEELIQYRIHKNPVIATREIPPPNPHTEKHITTEKDSFLRRIKRNASGRMARSVNNFEISFTNLHFIPFLEEQVRRGTGNDCTQKEQTTTLSQKRFIIFVNSENCPRSFNDLPVSHYVVKMAVGINHHRNLNSQLLHCLEDFARISSRINYHPTSIEFIGHNVTIGLKWADC